VPGAGCRVPGSGGECGGIPRELRTPGKRCAAAPPERRRAAGAHQGQCSTLPLLGIVSCDGRCISRQMAHGGSDQSTDVLGNVSLVDAIGQRGNLNQILCLCLRRAGTLSSVGLLRADGRGHGGGCDVHVWPWVKWWHGRHGSPAEDTGGQEKSTCRLLASA
jgi:hypothetical protein